MIALRFGPVAHDQLLYHFAIDRRPVAALDSSCGTDKRENAQAMKRVTTAPVTAAGTMNGNKGGVTGHRRSGVGSRTRTAVEKRRYEMPTVSVSPTSSSENLVASAAVASSRPSSVADLFSSPNFSEDHRRRTTCTFDFSNSPAAYRKTLQELEAIKQQSSGMNVSDCFSLSSSMSSETDLSPVFDVPPFSASTGAVGHQLFARELETSQLKEICAQTRRLEKRNEELKEELLRFKMDTAMRLDGAVDATNGTIGEQKL